MSDASSAHRRDVLRRAEVVAACGGERRVEALLALLEEHFGPTALHLATPDGFVLGGESATWVDPTLLDRVAAQHRAAVGDGPAGPGSSLACPVVAGGRVVAVVTTTCDRGWRPSSATLVDGVVTIGTPAFAEAQVRALTAVARSGGTIGPLVHDDAVQVLVAVAERLELVRAGILPTQELVGMRTELLRAASRLAGPAPAVSGAAR